MLHLDETVSKHKNSTIKTVEEQRLSNGGTWHDANPHLSIANESFSELPSMQCKICLKASDGKDHVTY